MYRALRCLVLLTAVSLGGAPAHAQVQSDTPGPKSIRVVFNGFSDDASKECGLDSDRIKSVVQGVVNARGLTVPTAAKADAEIQVMVKTMHQFDVCVTLLQLGLSAEGTVTLPFRTSDTGKEVFIQARTGVSINRSATPAIHAEAVERQFKSLATNMILIKW